jgi:hypothetical protein
MDIHSQVLVGNANDDLASLRCQWPQSYYIAPKFVTSENNVVPSNQYTEIGEFKLFVSKLVVWV